MSQSVTDRPENGFQLLQIETFGDAAEPLRRLDVCPDKTCQNKPVPFWQVLGLPGAGGLDVDVFAGYGVREGHAVGVEHQAAGARRAVQVVAH